MGLPEEAGADNGRPADNRRDEMLGEAAPPLVAEPEDRAGGPGGRERPKGALAWLIAFARPRKAKSAATIMEAGAEAEPESERLWASGRTRTQGQTRLSSRPPGRRWSRTKQKWASGARSQQWLRPNPGALFARKGAIAVVLTTGVAVAAIVILNWPHGSHPQVVEPGMLADQPTKVIAPSAELATVPPREEPNVAGERPQVHETRRDEVQEVLSFKDLKATASPPVGSPPPTPSPVGASVTEAKPGVPTPDPPAAAGPTLAVSGPVSPPMSAPPVAGSKAEKVASLPPPYSTPAIVTPVAAARRQKLRRPVLAKRRRSSRALGSSRRR